MENETNTSEVTDASTKPATTQSSETAANESTSEPNASFVSPDAYLLDDDEALMKGVLPVNIGAFFMPAIWGPAHGLWVTILFYPLWIFMDNLFYSAYEDPTPLMITVAVLVGIIGFIVTFVQAKISQKYALRRAIRQGLTKETYLKRQRIWAVCMVIVALIFLALATWYNITIHPFLDLEV